MKWPETILPAKSSPGGKEAKGWRFYDGDGKRLRKKAIKNILGTGHGKLDEACKAKTEVILWITPLSSAMIF